MPAKRKTRKPTVTLLMLKHQLMFHDALTKTSIWFIALLATDLMWIKLGCFFLMLTNGLNALKLAHYFPEKYFKLSSLPYLATKHSQKIKDKQEDDEIQRKARDKDEK